MRQIDTYTISQKNVKELKSILLDLVNIEHPNICAYEIMVAHPRGCKILHSYYPNSVTLASLVY